MELVSKEGRKEGSNDALKTSGFTDSVDKVFREY
jgi:hypothetical protein